MTALGDRPRSEETTEEERLRADMQAFDGLPPTYREVVRHSPLEIPAATARAYLSAFGDRLGLRLLKWSVNWRLRKNRRSVGATRSGKSR